MELINSLVEKYNISKFNESTDGVSLFFDEENEWFIGDVMYILNKNDIEFEEENSYLYITYN